MSGVGSLASRIARLERMRAKASAESASPFQRWYDALDSFVDHVQTGMEAGTYDPRDMPVVLASIERWHREGLYG